MAEFMRLELLSEKEYSCFMIQLHTESQSLKGWKNLKQ